MCATVRGVYMNERGREICPVSQCLIGMIAMRGALKYVYFLPSAGGSEHVHSRSSVTRCGAVLKSE